MKASDIDDGDILRNVEQSCIDRGVWSNTTARISTCAEFNLRYVFKLEAQDVAH